MEQSQNLDRELISFSPTEKLINKIEVKYFKLVAEVLLLAASIGTLDYDFFDNKLKDQDLIFVKDEATIQETVLIFEKIMKTKEIEDFDIYDLLFILCVRKTVDFNMDLLKIRLENNENGIEEEISQLPSWRYTS